MNNEQIKQWYLQSMGIETYADKSTEPVENRNPLNWSTLENSVKNCTRCLLHQTRTQTVFGVGSKTADLVFIGEAPGQQEDLQGEPFVGRAGQLLDQMLKAIGLTRDEIYIANILKCRPPQNRDPKPEEQKYCTPFLLDQLKLLQPKLIVSLGRISAQYLLQSNLALARFRGKTHSYSDGNIPLLVTYHPAYLLRNPRDKAKSWEDLLSIKRFLDLA